jgi:hypothetical protein
VSSGASAWRDALSRALAFGAAALLSCWLTRPLAADLRATLDAQAALAASSDSAVARPTPSASRLRVLFVGNSLTAYNHMPNTIARLAAAAGEARPLAANLLCPGGSHLNDRARQEELKRRLARTRFDYVVLQNQGQVSGWPAQREAEMLEPGRVLAGLIAHNGAHPLLYATFARREGDFDEFPGDSYEAMQARVNEGYAALGDEIGATVVPVGRIWQETLRVHPTLRLWALDGYHPSVAGSYLIACAFFAQLYGRSPVGNRYHAGLDPADARTIQESVARALSQARRSVLDLPRAQE